MNAERIKEIQGQTAYPNSVSVQQALLKVWNECEQVHLKDNNEIDVCPDCGADLEIIYTGEKSCTGGL